MQERKTINKMKTIRMVNLAKKNEDKEDFLQPRFHCKIKKQSGF